MVDYVERDKVIREMEWYIERIPDCAECLEARKRIIAHIPSADVRPVVRGRWEEWWPSDCALIMTGEEMLWMCSECTAKFSDRSAYCPNCGAMMEES